MLVPPVRSGNGWLHTSVGYGAFVLGLLGGGLVTTTLLFLLSGLVQWLDRPERIAAVVAGAAIALGIETGLASWTLPGSRLTRLIPPTRFARSVARGMMAFGFELGLGFRTYVPSSAPYLAVVVFVFFNERPLGAVWLAGGWALGRSATAMYRALVGRVADDDQPEHRVEQLRKSDAMTSRLNVIARLAALGLPLAVMACAGAAVIPSY